VLDFICPNCGQTNFDSDCMACPRRDDGVTTDSKWKVLRGHAE
jgi:hypothetical protein